MFNILFNMLRIGVVYLKFESLGFLDRLIEEVMFYGIEECFWNVYGCVLLNGIDVEKVKLIIFSGIDIFGVLVVGLDGFVWIGYGSKIIVYDWVFCKKKIIFMEFGFIDIMYCILDDLVVGGEKDLLGFYLYDVM